MNILLKMGLTLFLMVGLTFGSCIGEKCPPVLPHFEIQQLQSVVLRYPYSNSTQKQVVLKGDTVNWNEYSTGINAEVNYVAAANHSNWGFGSNLYALSCVESGWDGTHVGVKSLDVITLQVFDSNYVENDTLTSLIRINDFPHEDSFPGGGLSVSEFEMLYKESMEWVDFQIMIQQKPLHNYQLTQFRVVLELMDGSVFETLTDEVYIR